MIELTSGLQVPGRSVRGGWLLVLAAAACGPAPEVRIDPAEEQARLPDSSPACTDTPVVSLEEVARGLEVPWGLDVAPDGRIFVTERPGRIRVIGADGLQTEPWAVLDVYDVSEAGLLGIALSPDFATDGHVFVAATFLRSGSSLPYRAWGALVRRVESWAGVREGGTSVVLRVIRFTERDGRGVDPLVIVDDIPAHQLHAGSAVRFGPDGALHVTMGDGSFPSTAADRNDRRGTILRYRPDGSIPEDNPIAGSAVLAHGFRDVQGMEWHPATGELFAVDHGPTGLDTEGFRANRDELNRVVAGGDHGWPRVSGRVDLEGTVVPLHEWTPAVAPSGLDFHRDPTSPYFGNILVGSLRGQGVERVVVDQGSGGAPGTVCAETLLQGELGRIRGIRWDGEGLLVSTSNRDRRGAPSADDDRVFRMTLTPP